jgi:hypothetical protein
MQAWVKKEGGSKLNEKAGTWENRHNDNGAWLWLICSVWQRFSGQTKYQRRTCFFISVGRD